MTFSQLQDGDLVRVAEIDRSGDLVGRGHQPQQPFDEVVDEAERARLAAAAVDRDRLALERLDDEVGDHAAVLRLHVGAVGVEDPRHPDRHAVLAVVVEEQGLGAALALVVAGARAQRVDVAEVALGLRVDRRVAIDLAGRGLQDLGFDRLAKPSMLIAPWTLVLVVWTGSNW